MQTADVTIPAPQGAGAGRPLEAKSSKLSMVSYHPCKHYKIQKINLTVAWIYKTPLLMKEFSFQDKSKGRPPTPSYGFPLAVYKPHVT